MKIYNIIGGVNGSGKSSLAGVLSSTDTGLGKIIDPDKINIQFGGDRIKGGKAALKLIDECMEKGVNFAQETTLSGRNTLKTIAKARERGYTVRLYYVGLNSCEESLNRIANRVKKGGHNIPEADVKRRYEKRFEDLYNVLTACDTAIFYDNENGFVRVGEYLNGRLMIYSGDIPEWLSEFNKVYNSKI